MRVMRCKKNVKTACTFVKDSKVKAPPERLMWWVGDGGGGGGRGGAGSN